MARERTIRSEQGAVFVQVGIALFVLMAFNVFVLDYGVMWIARRQAQNAADAGALAGGTARAYDDFDDPPASGGVAEQSAHNVAEANLIWQEPGSAVVSFDCPGGGPGKCVKVTVYRNGTNGSNALDMMFGPILGLSTQGVLATATSIVANGNATNCLRPIALADSWVEANPPLSPTSTFRRYDESTGALLANPDSYVAPGAAQAGNTVYSVDLGERRIWNLDSPITAPINDGFVLELDLPGPESFIDTLTGCSGQIVQLQQTLPVRTPPTGETLGGFNNLMSQDPDVDWNDADRRIDNSCAPGCAPISPRLIPIALFDPARFQLGRATGDWTQADVGCPTNSPCITVTNIVGFFVHGSFGGYGPHGHFLKYPGMTAPAGPTFVDDASWLVTTHLIR